MPKLMADVAEKVSNAEDGFKPVEEGIYTLQLAEDVDVKEGAKGPYWRWTFVVPEDAEQYAGRKFFTNTSLSEAAFFKLKETFSAFGVPTDTDTEDLVGQRVKAHITIRTIQGGSRAGEPGNEIAKLLPLDVDEETIAKVKGAVSNIGGANQVSAGVTSKKDDEPLF